MSDSVKRVSVRLSVDGADTVQRNLAAVGETGERNLRRVGSAAQQTSRELQQVDQIAQRAASRPNFGQIAGQAGFQVQDFATQVAMGQNAMVAFGTQFAQFAGMFGVGGAIAGAAVTLGLIGVQFLNLGQQADTLNDNLERQDNLWRAATEAGNRYRQGLEAQRAAITELLNSYGQLTAAQIQSEARRAQRVGDDLLAERGRLSEQAQGALGRLPRVAAEWQRMRSAAGAGPLPDQVQDALRAVMEFRASDANAESMAQLARRLTEIAGVVGGPFATGLFTARDRIDELLPRFRQLDERLELNGRQQRILTELVEQSAQALTAQGGAVSGVVTQLLRIDALQQRLSSQGPLSLGGLNDLQAQAFAAEQRLQAFTAGGEIGLTAADDRARVAQLADRARQADIDAMMRVQRLSPEDAALLADDPSRAAARSEAAQRLVDAERRLAAGREGAQAFDRTLDERDQAAGRPNALRDAVRDIERRTEAEQRMTDVLGRGIEVEREAERQNRIAEALQRVLRDGTIERAEAERALTRAITEQMAVEDRARTARAANDNRREADRLALRGTMIGASAVDRAMMQAEARARESMGLRMNDPLNAGQKGVIGDALDNARRLTELERMEAAYTELGRIGEQAFDRIGGAITQAMAQGRMSFEDLRNIGNSVISELLQAFVRLAVMNPLKNAFFGGNSPTLGDAGGILGSLLGLVTGGIGGGLGVKADMGLIEPGFTGFAPWGGYRADGGAVSAGAAFMVGERGPELFVPGADGAIVPNAKLGGGNVTFNVAFSGNAGDPSDRAALIDGLRAMVRAELAAGAPGLVRASHDYTMDRISRGGAAARIVGRGS